MNSDKKDKLALPPYLNFIYGHIYRRPEKCVLLDSNLLCNLKAFFQYKKLSATTTKEIKRSQAVLQMGLTFGNQIDETAMAIGSYGQYDIIDINQNEVTRAIEKYWQIYKNLKIFKQDARTMKATASYDVVICFMLLSQVPSASKYQIVNNALKMVKPGGKVVFIDWHNPLYWHPLRYLVRMYNRLYHPFVERLWDRDIETYATNKMRGQFSWLKSTYFGRMFQKTVAIRKEDPNKPQEEENFFNGSAFGSVDA